MVGLATQNDAWPTLDSLWADFQPAFIFDQPWTTFGPTLRRLSGQTAQWNLNWQTFGNGWIQVQNGQIWFRGGLSQPKSSKKQRKKQRKTKKNFKKKVPK